MSRRAGGTGCDLWILPRGKAEGLNLKNREITEKDEGVNADVSVSSRAHRSSHTREVLCECLNRGGEQFPGEANLSDCVGPLEVMYRAEVEVFSMFGILRF